MGLGQDKQYQPAKDEQRQNQQDQLRCLPGQDKRQATAMTLTTKIAGLLRKTGGFASYLTDCISATPLFP